MSTMFDAFIGFDLNDDASSFMEAIWNFSDDHSPGIDNPVKLHLEQVATDKDFSYHLDALGSVRSLTDSDGTTAVSYTYTPYGEMTTTDGTDNDAKANHNTFTARDYETSFMMFYRSRFYANRMGRFFKKDVALFNYYFPLSIDRYLYIDGNPLNAVDPYGKFRMESSHIPNIQIEPGNNVKVPIKISSQFDVLIDSSCEGLGDNYQAAINGALSKSFLKIVANPNLAIEHNFKLRYQALFYQRIIIYCPYWSDNCMAKTVSQYEVEIEINTRAYSAETDDIELTFWGRHHCDGPHKNIIHELTHHFFYYTTGDKEECMCDICGGSMFPAESDFPFDRCDPYFYQENIEKGVCNGDLDSWPSVH